MKKLIALLLLTSTNAFAALDCQELPSCESLGYVCSAEDCGVAKTLSCPFDQSKKICWPETKECQEGDVLYNDFKCHTVACGKTPIAVVYDTENKLAIRLDKTSNYIWGNYGIDIPELKNCTATEALNLPECTNGKDNTKKIVDYGLANNLEYPAAEFCYNSTFGNVPQGSWWLPSAKEIKTIHQNPNKIIETFGKYNLTLSNEALSSSNEVALDQIIMPQRVSGALLYSDKSLRLTIYCVTGY